MNKTVQNLKMKIESIKKIQTEWNLEVKILRIQTDTTETTLSTKYKWWKRISGTEDTIEDISTSFKEVVNSKILRTQKKSKKYVIVWKDKT